MRKILIAITAILALLAISTPANAGEQIQQTPSTVQAEEQWKMGGLPNHYTICVANGIGGTYNTEYVLEQWTQLSYGALNLSVRNICTGYSITNRMTIESYVDSTTSCVKFTNTHKTWSPAQGKYIWDQNVVVWVNHSDYCLPNDTAHAHRLQMYVGYILGLSYITSGCSYVMTATICGINGIKYVTNTDRSMMAGVYGLAA